MQNKHKRNASQYTKIKFIQLEIKDDDTIFSLKNYIFYYLTREEEHVFENDTIFLSAKKTIR